MWRRKGSKFIECSERLTPLISLMLETLKKRSVNIFRRKQIKQADKKAELCISWSKYLDNFKPGRSTKERQEVNGIFGKSFGSAREVHNFITHLHCVVYQEYHTLVYESKKTESHQASDASSSVDNSIYKESKDKIYCFAGSSCRMKKTRKRALSGRGREVSNEKRKDVKGTPERQITDKVWWYYMLKIAEDCILNDLELSSEFYKCLSCESKIYRPEIVTMVFKELIRSRVD